MTENQKPTLQELREAVERELNVQYAGEEEGQHLFITSPDALLALDAYAREVARRAFAREGHYTGDDPRWAFDETIDDCLRALGLAEKEADDD